MSDRTKKAVRAGRCMVVWRQLASGNAVYIGEKEKLYGDATLVGTTPAGLRELAMVLNETADEMEREMKV